MRYSKCFIALISFFFYCLFIVCLVFFILYIYFFTSRILWFSWTLLPHCYLYIFLTSLVHAVSDLCFVIFPISYFSVFFLILFFFPFFPLPFPGFFFPSPWRATPVSLSSLLYSFSAAAAGESSAPLSDFQFDIYFFLFIYSSPTGCGGLPYFPLPSFCLTLSCFTDFYFVLYFVFSLRAVPRVP